MRRPGDELMRAHHVLVPTDNSFQRRARLLQALWREAEGLPSGMHRGAPLGSRIMMPRAEQSLENYLTPTIRAVVRREVIDRRNDDRRLFGRPRIFNDLLSSQPLCFNLFAELAEDLALATRVFERLVPDRIGRVEAIDFEHSPGRGDPRLTGDNSAFDVFVQYMSRAGRCGFVGVEVKYHESLRDKAAKLRPRYETVAAAMGAFREDRLPSLRAKPLQQVWRDHLLAGSMLAAGDGWSEGLFVFLHPRDNANCVSVVDEYRKCLTRDDTFTSWTLEDVVGVMREMEAGDWIDRLWRRYLAFEQVDRAIADAATPRPPT